MMVMPWGYISPVLVSLGIGNGLDKGPWNINIFILDGFGYIDTYFCHDIHRCVDIRYNMARQDHKPEIITDNRTAE